MFIYHSIGKANNKFIGVKYCMELIVLIIVILATWRWGDWKNWHKYQSTMLLSCVGNLLYNFIYSSHRLWKMQPNFFPNFISMELFYTFIVFPLTVLIFLTNHPIKIKSQILHIIKCITIFMYFELVFMQFGKIEYNYGWNIWWSLAWNCMMFPMWALHHKKPLVAYVATVLTVITMLILFPVSFN